MLEEQLEGVCWGVGMQRNDFILFLALVSLPCSLAKEALWFRWILACQYGQIALQRPQSCSI